MVERVRCATGALFDRLVHTSVAPRNQPVTAPIATADKMIRDAIVKQTTKAAIVNFVCAMDRLSPPTPFLIPSKAPIPTQELRSLDL